ncbi:carbohydrate-binding protein, partial [Francisellaceae bacterium]|nr:carbohydrate-binding protein [Francisellaceae bacterium]
VYQDGDKAVKSGVVYEAQWWSQGQNPISNSGQYQVWKAIGQGSASPTPSVLTWTVNGVYQKGDKVNYQGSTYEAKWWTQGKIPDQHSSQWDVWKKIN